MILVKMHFLNIDSSGTISRRTLGTLAFDSTNLSNLANKDEENTFTAKNNFQGGLTASNIDASSIDTDTLFVNGLLFTEAEAVSISGSTAFGTAASASSNIDPETGLTSPHFLTVQDITHQFTGSVLITGSLVLGETKGDTHTTINVSSSLSTLNTNIANNTTTLSGVSTNAGNISTNESNISNNSIAITNNSQSAANSFLAISNTITSNSQSAAASIIINADLITTNSQSAATSFLASANSISTNATAITTNSQSAATSFLASANSISTNATAITTNSQSAATSFLASANSISTNTTAITNNSQSAATSFLASANSISFATQSISNLVTQLSNLQGIETTANLTELSFDSLFVSPHNTASVIPIDKEKSRI